MMMALFRTLPQQMMKTQAATIPIRRSRLLDSTKHPRLLLASLLLIRLPQWRAQSPVEARLVNERDESLLPYLHLFLLLMRVSILFILEARHSCLSVFSVRLWVASGAAKLHSSITVQSDVSYLDMHAAVAKELGISPSALELCYLFSFIRSAKMYRKLTNDEHWQMLLADARNYRNKTTTKRNNNQDAWHVDLKEQRELMQAANTKPHSNKVRLYMVLSIFLSLTFVLEPRTCGSWSSNGYPGFKPAAQFPIRRDQATSPGVGGQDSLQFPWKFLLLNRYT